MSPAARQARSEAKANAFGKVATAFQFGAILAGITRSPVQPWLVGATAAVGTLAAVSYWARETRSRA